VHTIELTDDELDLLRQAVKSFLDDFGHEQEEIVIRIEALLERLESDA